MTPGTPGAIPTCMDPHRLLIAIDDSEATRRAVEYVATVAPRSLRSVVLFHVLPPLPPALLEHGGVADADAVADLEQEVREAQRLRGEARRRVEQGLFEWTRSRLMASGVPETAILLRTSTAANATAVVGEIISAAHEHKCRTVVVGRESFSRLRELFGKHICDDLLRADDELVVWVVQ